MKGDFPGQDKEAKKAGEESYEAVRAKAQSLVSQLLVVHICYSRDALRDVIDGVLDANVS